MPELALYKVKLLDEFEARGDEWTCGHFERRLTEVKPAAYYQDAKGIIIAAYKAGNWPNTVCSATTRRSAMSAASSAKFSARYWPA